MLRFYDHLRRQSQQVKRFEELIAEALGSDDVDRATARMRHADAFLAAAFREYERRVRDSGGCDEHMLRERLMAEPALDPLRHVIVTVADWIADADGLFAADFDLLARIPGSRRSTSSRTERVLARVPRAAAQLVAGAGRDRCRRRRRAPVAAASCSTPPAAPPEEPWCTLRDREEELVTSRGGSRPTGATASAVPLDRTAIVFKRPLPYLYLAAEVFGAAGIPYQASDALPLAAEPTAAALDLVLDAVASNFTRGTLVALLRSPHFVFRHDEVEVTRESVGALDRALSEARYLGDLERLETLAGGVGRRVRAGAARGARRGARAGAAGRAAPGIGADRALLRSGGALRGRSPTTIRLPRASAGRARPSSTC